MKKFTSRLAARLARMGLGLKLAAAFTLRARLRDEVIGKLIYPTLLIHLALLGKQLGFDTTIVVEKPSELDMILQEAAKLGVMPGIGVRLRLSTLGAGKSSIKVTLAGTTTSSRVFAVLHSNRTGRWVQSVVPTTGSFTIYLNGTVTASTYIAWFVIN